MSTPFIGHAVATATLAILSLSPMPPSAQEKQAGPAKAGTAKSAPAGPATQASIAELWVEPKNIAERDLLLGPGGPKDVPSKDGVYTVVGQDSTGNSFGYDVTDQQKAVIAFQRRFRPDLIDGIIDGECRAKLLALLLPRPQ